MIVYFKNTRLAKTLDSQKETVRTYGPENGKKIMQRLQELRAFENLSQVPTTPPARRHELSGNKKGTFAVDVKHPFRLLFKPAHDPVPLKGNGGIDLEKVTEIVVTDITDYH